MTHTRFVASGILLVLFMMALPTVAASDEPTDIVSWTVDQIWGDLTGETRPSVSLTTEQVLSDLTGDALPSVCVSGLELPPFYETSWHCTRL